MSHEYYSHPTLDPNWVKKYTQRSWEAFSHQFARSSKVKDLLRVRWKVGLVYWHDVVLIHDWSLRGIMCLDYFKAKLTVVLIFESDTMSREGPVINVYILNLINYLLSVEFWIFKSYGFIEKTSVSVPKEQMIKSNSSQAIRDNFLVENWIISVMIGLDMIKINFLATLSLIFCRRFPLNATFMFGQVAKEFKSPIHSGRWDICDNIISIGIKRIIS